MPAVFQRCQLSGHFSAAFLPSDPDNAITALANINIAFGFEFTYGTGSGQVNQVLVKTASVAASANNSTDLAGTVTNRFGETIVLTAVKAVVFENRSANAATIFTFANTGGTWPATQWAVPVGRGCPFIWAEPHAGVTVTATSGDTLRITNTDATNAGTYQIAILGIQ